MLTAIFANVLRLSAMGAVLIALAAAFRLIFRKIPRAVFCVIWILIALRLVLPFSLESSLSPVPAKYSQEAISEAVTEYISEGPVSVLPAENVNRFSSDGAHVYFEVPDETVVLKDQVSALDAASYIWLAGAVMMLAYAVFSYLKMRRRVGASIKLEGEERVYICDDIDGAFILGTFRPRIYLPSGLADEARNAVTAHEKAHLARFDHVVKPLFFAVLAVHWFDPLVWAAYAMLCRDIEFACDEKVLRGLEPDGVRAYSNALLACGSGRFRLSANPLAFGETGVRERVKAALRYKKPTHWALAAAVVCVLLFAGCTLSRPADPGQSAQSSADSEPGTVISSGNQDPISPESANPVRNYSTADGTVFSDLESYLYYLEGDFFGTTNIDGVDVENSYVPSSRMELYECKPHMSDWKGYAWGLASREDTVIKEMYLVDIGAASLNDNTEIYRVGYEKPDEGTDGSSEGDNIWYMVTYVCDTENGDRIGPKVIGVLPLDAMRQYTSREWIDEYYCPARAAAMDARSGYLQRFAYDEEGKNPWQICGAEYDIDGDGFAEKINVTYGNTSGIFSFIVTISGERGFEHQSAFTLPNSDLALIETREGLRLTGRPDPHKGSDMVVLYEIVPDHGAVRLVDTSSGRELQPFD